MFESRHRSGGSSANRWLIVAGGGLVILAFVARMLLDIGHTKVSDLAGVLRPDTATATPAPAPAPAPVLVDTVAAIAATSPAATEAPAVSVPETTATSPNVPPSRPTEPTPPASGSRYVIQIGAFGSEANANRLGQRATGLGYETSVIPETRGATALYLVRVAGAGTPADARAAADSLAKALGVRAVVLRQGH